MKKLVSEFTNVEQEYIEDIRFNTCAPGIHFFMTMMEAYTYPF